MQPVTKDFAFLDGDTPPRLGFRLLSRNIRSGGVTPRPAGEDLVTWSIRWPDGVVINTSAVGGGLLVDRRSRFVFYPLPADKVAAVPVDAPARYDIRLTDGDGITRTYVQGTITKRARPL